MSEEKNIQINNAENAQNGVEKIEKKSIKGKGGARPGAGRPKGKLSAHTIMKNLAEKAFKDRIVRSTDKLVTSQMNLAQGVQMLYCIGKDSNGKNKKPEIVTDKSIIADFLAGELENTDKDYYFITTERPDNKALDSLLDRAYGKATQKNEHTGKDGEPLNISVMSFKDKE